MTQSALEIAMTRQLSLMQHKAVDPWPAFETELHSFGYTVCMARRVHANQPQPPELRFWPKVDKSGDCWIWTAARNPQGYGQFGDGTRIVQAHRFAWQLAHGPIPDGVHVLHSCDNPPCVRHDHLRLGDDKDNAIDRGARGREGVNQNARKTHCPHGHAYDEANTYRDKVNRRYCRSCHRLRHSASRGGA